MSLHFSQDTLTKWEKQEMFKRSLDDQRRMKQGTSHQQYNNLPSNTGNHVPGLASSSVAPDDLSIPGLNQVVPGLNQRPGHAPRFEGSSSPQQEKKPYMSALSEMNGRPLHVRQQQFQKESQYRNMLKDQIEENKKRKQAEKAKLDEEKRLELEEVRRLQGMSGPRRQQHAQFQESPDHPLPSPGRLPPARHTHATVDRHQHQHRGGNVSDRAGAIAPVDGSAMNGGYASMNPPGINDRGYDGGGQGHPGAPVYRRDQVSGDYRRPYAHPQQTETAVYAGDYAPDGRQDLALDAQVRTHTSSRRFDEYRQGFGDAGRPQGRLDTTGQARGAESAARKPAFEAEGVRSAAQSSDSVPRADFDELSNLCRDLLLEQKELRRKLEDREERDRLATERSREEMTRRPKKHQDREHQHQRGVSRSGGAAGRPSGGTPCRSGDRIRRTQSLSGSGASRMLGSSNPSTLRRERKPVPKSGVAFGSTRSRMPSPTVEKPRVPPRGTRGNRDSRVTKSEPIPRTDHLSDLRPTRNVVSTNGDAGGSSGKLFVNREAFDSGRPSIASKDTGDTGSERFAEPDRVARGSDLAPPEESGGNARGASASEAGGGASSTVYGLLSSGKGLGREDFGREEAESTRRLRADSRGRIGGGELGGESTFLAAHPTDSGFTGLEGGAWALRRGAY
ncbi:unnamed protein product [Ectocarpus sp. 12 AP-2014]